ncbi:MAG: preprotein translocase subunit YajC [Clostridia bacterium]|nr:preprotein translocase subunit YajC [Clostridia bacterium]
MGGWGIILMYAAIIGVLYLVMIRPQKKRQKQEDELRKNIEIGDEIITIGGICGRVVSVKEDDTIVIESGADRTKLKMKSWCISSNETAAARVAAQQPETQKKKGIFSK